MNETELIVNVFRQTFLGSAWHGPSLMEVLNGVDKTQARARPIEARHTIWEIVNHCSYWMEAVTGALHGEKMPDIVSAEDWPQMGETNQDWTKAQERLKKAYE
ncbi:MAG: DinB family protein, partial [Candidatus Bathyarchaeia archaeon]